MTRRLWLVNLLLAVGCSGIGGLDLATGHPMLAPLMFTSAVVNGIVGGFNKRHYACPPEPPHRPDYAKIRRLELELGLRDPDPVPDPEPVVQVTRLPRMYCAVCRGRSAHLRGCPYADPPKFETGLPPSRFDPRSRGQHYERVVPPAVTSPNEWVYCPVCTRRHAGRCAG